MFASQARQNLVHHLMFLFDTVLNLLLVPKLFFTVVQMVIPEKVLCIFYVKNWKFGVASLKKFWLNFLIQIVQC